VFGRSHVSRHRRAGHLHDRYPTGNQPISW
jgi:hypothetical protein